MKNQFEIPVMSISMFHNENVATTASAGAAENTNVTAMKGTMETAGYTVTTKSLTGFAF